MRHTHGRRRHFLLAISGITTVYHFILVLLTIGLRPDDRGDADDVAFHWQRRVAARATKFFGKLFLINFAPGVATGIVQEFQFGMN